ncbi:MAG: transcriptional regulator, AbrB family [Candidatus Electronema aureum]|uniref:Transcriptional regulator, AbrB family n=1 Tax=Candidatus Electronema aureum TaxID=2005002 RepID=A0A521G5P2_9BACT|nr:MAG: transcriptional regulator, AbrB family [Candidatus Electronema aureum]
MTTSTVTTRGQVTIPKHIRKLLKIDRGDKVEFMVDKNGAVMLQSVTSDVALLKGMVPKPEKYVSIEDMNNAVLVTQSPLPSRQSERL